MQSESTIDFTSSFYSIDALKEAAYRFLDRGSVVFEEIDNGWRCRLTSKVAGPAHAESLRSRFLELVTDELLREKVSRQTAPTRNLIMALAFGGLAECDKFPNAHNDDKF